MTKELVLQYFESNKGCFISGEELAEKIGVSRTAIWKAINRLREEGYDIEALPKKGYCLNENSDILSIVKIQDQLQVEGVFDFRLYKTIDSTNKKAKILALTEEKEWIVVASEKQEKGKGQRKKVFTSPEGKGVYVSVVLMPKRVIAATSELTTLAAAAAQEVIEEIAGVKTTFEAPSIFYKGKKLGGILTEVFQEADSRYVDAVIVGIGLNIYGDEKDFSHQEDDIHISLSQIIGRYCNRSELIAAWVSALYRRYQQYFLSI